MTRETQLRPGLIGAKVSRREDARFLTGRGHYVDDRKLPGTLHIAFRRSEFAHARISRIDVDAASRSEGVVGVYSASDLIDQYTPLRATSRMSDYYPTELPVLAMDKVRFVGEAIVAVVATSRALAEDAAERIDIAFQPLDAVVDPINASASDAVRVHDDIAFNVVLSRTFSRADAEASFVGAHLVVRERFRMRRKAPAALENRSYLADFDPGTQYLTLHSATQVPGIIRDALAEALTLSGNQIRVIAGDVGGGFGAKASLYPEELLVCLLSRMLERPVKWTADRLEDLLTTTQAFDEVVDAALAFDASGNILGLQAEVLGDIGAYSVYPWTAALEPVQVVSFLPGPYRVPAYLGRVRGITTCKAPTGPYRGVGRPVSTFVMERLMDIAARRLAVDAVELRRQNLVRADELPYRAASGLVWSDVDFHACLDAACDGIAYRQVRSRQRQVNPDGKCLGIGVASYAELTGIGSRISAAPGMPINTGTETSTIRIDSSGGITAYFGIASHGQGLETTLAQIIADELGVGIDDVRIVHGDSDAVSHGTGTYASRSTVLAGGAATLSARRLRERVLHAASHLLEADQSDLELHDAVISVTGTDRQIRLRELARAIYSEMGRLPKEVRETIELEATETYDPYFGATTPATHAALVAVDPETFEVDIVRYVVAEDCGRVINPLIADGQVHGGVAQGIGAALLEAVVHDEDGQVLSANLADYLVPTATDVPPIEVHHLETGTPDNVGKFRGLGEGGTIGAPAAIANAISDALAHLGIEVNDVPVSPDALFHQARNQQTAP
ncbi:MAG: xanthine dehydrogenase family protein molybdopterin-binding subunit [Pseudomonadota bacterium]